ncbi:MAG: hypothetical protein QNI88_17680, partial [Desulfobacterales bacterium]|nr:hypothetical protein [Desulfobacterales bacterium]
RPALPDSLMLAYQLPGDAPAGVKSLRLDEHRKQKNDVKSRLGGARNSNRPLQTPHTAGWGTRSFRTVFHDPFDS